MQTTRWADPMKILTRSEMRAVLGDLKRKAPQCRNTRLNLIIFLLSACCGLRASEIAQLRLGGGCGRERRQVSARFERIDVG